MHTSIYNFNTRDRLYKIFLNWGGLERLKKDGVQPVLPLLRNSLYLDKAGIVEKREQKIFQDFSKELEKMYNYVTFSQEKCQKTAKIEPVLQEICRITNNNAE